MTEKNGRNLKKYVEKLAVEKPLRHRNLTLVPMAYESESLLEYVLAGDAIDAGLLSVTEVNEAGSVPELLVTSQAEQMVLLIDGEELVGAKQNRIMNTTVLLPAQARTRIPVSCVEQGRWRSVSAKFASGGFSPSKLRAAKSRSVSDSLRRTGKARSNQGEVWDHVHCSIAESGTASPTMAMHDAFEQRRDMLDEYMDALSHPEGASGIIAAIDGKFAAMDVFDNAETLQKLWTRLITGYALDALGSLRRQQDALEKLDFAEFTEKGAGALLEHVGELDCEPCPSVGLGEDWRFESPSVVGQALVVKETCVHLGAFPNYGTDEQTGRPRGSRIARPSRRRTYRRRHGDDGIIY